jgi:hypothetical protein
MARKPSHPEPEEYDEPEPAPPADEPPQREPPPPARTIADEQRERSEEIQRKGVEAWKAEHDQRSDEDKTSKPVPGATQTKVEASELRGRR